MLRAYIQSSGQSYEYEIAGLGSQFLNPGSASDSVEPCDL